MADILRHVPSKVPHRLQLAFHGIEIPITSMYFVFPSRTFLWLIEPSCLWLDHSDSEDYFLMLLYMYLQNGSTHSVGANYSGLYEEGEVPQLLCETEPS